MTAWWVLTPHGWRGPFEDRADAERIARPFGWAIEKRETA